MSFMSTDRSQSRDHAPALAVITSVHGSRDGDAYILDQKALTGMTLWAKHWPGRVYWALSMGEVPPSYSISCKPSDLPFEIIEVAGDRSDAVRALPPDALIQASADSWLDLQLAHEAPGRVVYVLEYTLKTRLDILRVSRQPWHRKMRTALWELRTERKRVRAIRAAAGLHCNGLAAAREYGPFAANVFQFFDTRLDRSQHITPDHLSVKHERMGSGQPLRLAFSGRLDRMKGAHWLLPLARALRMRGIAFSLEIFGDGECAADLRAAASSELQSNLVVHGPVDFAEVLVPAMKDRIDLFVCLHPQGDPACTYMETLGCGVPIVGFANEAWAAMVDGQPLGLASPVGDVEAIADIVGRLDKDRGALVAMSDAAASFSQSRCFEDVFLARLEEFRTLASRRSSVAAAEISVASPFLPQRLPA